MAVDTPNNDIQDKKLQDISENPVNKNILGVDNGTVDKLSNTLEFDMEDEERELLTTILQIGKNNIHLEDGEYYEGREGESKKIDELLNILSKRNNHENDIPFDTKFDLINTIFTTLNNHLNTSYFKIEEGNRKGLKGAIVEYIGTYCTEYEENDDFEEIKYMLMQKIKYGERLQEIHSEF